MTPADQASPDVREVLEAAWLTIHHEGYVPENERDTCRKCDRFTRFLDAEAYTDAALMLVPNGDEIALGILQETLAQTALRAKGPGHEQ